jgi:hypothetical protein
MRNRNQNKKYLKNYLTMSALSLATCITANSFAGTNTITNENSKENQNKYTLSSLSSFALKPVVTF